MKRKAAVAGQFYPGRADELRRMIRTMVDPEAPKAKALAVVSPHAGYVYSGPVAGAVFSSVELPGTFVVLAPSHRPIRTLFGIMDEGEWETPLGSIGIAAGLAAAIQAGAKSIRTDAAAHAAEHALEVQLPFLQYFKKDFEIVPIAVSYLASYDDLAELGSAMAAAIRARSEDVLIVASTDMSHYVSRDEARRKDTLAIERILALDPQGLFDVVTAEDITMCGFQPVTAALVAAKALGARKAELVKYATSGDVTGDDRQVVGYAGLRVL